MNPAISYSVIVHVGAALSAIVVGAVAFLARNGTQLHRIAGRAWFALRVISAVSAFWIRSGGSFSWIHGLSVVALVMVVRSVYLAINGNIRGHRKTVWMTYAGALGVAGLFSLMPQRLLGQLLSGGFGLI